MINYTLYEFAKSIPLARGFTHKECPYHTGSVIENRLGSQVGRTIGKHLAWRFRKRAIPPEIQEYVNILEREGVLVISNFLRDETAPLVREEFDRAQVRLEFSNFRGVAGGRLKVASLAVSERDEGFKHIREHLQDNPTILKIVAAIIRRPIASKPPLTINVYRKDNDLAPDNDIENILHADLHTPTVKAFYYLNDVDEGNGAFVYAKGTQTFSCNRLRHEYDMSVRSSKLRSGCKDIPQELLTTRSGNKRNIIRSTYMRKLGAVETPICGKANTLVIANNMGFHRRGEFTSERPRETIMVNFRYLERPF